MPSHRISAPDAMPMTEKQTPCAYDSRPDGSGRPTVRAMSASRVRSWTWFSAEAPQDRSITPASVQSAAGHGKSRPSGALSMNPAALETRTNSTIPNLDNSAYAVSHARNGLVGLARGRASTVTLDMHDPNGSVP